MGDVPETLREGEGTLGHSMPDKAVWHLSAWLEQRFGPRRPRGGE